MAELDPGWFTGLPYDEDHARELRASSHKPVGRDRKPMFRPQPAWSTGEIDAQWHSEPLFPSVPLSAEIIANWLDLA